MNRFVHMHAIRLLLISKEKLHYQNKEKMIYSSRRVLQLV